IVKEQCRYVFAAARGVHITLSRFRVKHLFRFSLLTRRRVCRCSVSVEAHYRALFLSDKRKFKKSF
ncbi:hypothetical protein L8Q47_17995, partial [Enterobacter bugandensis]|uniref:hypothetical protein n=1 Tax=Enterobacter bugandensis TaxID=881260 RepID=UPI00200515CE